ncbi:MAG TPA: hypothetical protein VN048_05275 [Verrucomicrobiae bacterium]|jgi:hypothetical protein|nr:hypothetical protein [Verrucomicrobiae bacterium]
MPYNDSELTEFASKVISLAFRDLLETKHLYQSIDISEKTLDDFIANQVKERRIEVARSEPGFSSGRPDAIATAVRGTLQTQKQAALNSPWDFMAETSRPTGELERTPRISEGFPPMTLPSVRVSCGSKECKGTIQPHNSGYVGADLELSSYILPRSESIVQIFSLVYQCQNCKGEPLVFLVKRNGLKLTLTGRSRFPDISVPTFIPEEQRNSYKKAIISHTTSFTLGAALYLRSVIEQHFYKTIPEAEIRAITGNPTGDALADLYAKILPKDFPSNFPSLKKAYGDLSAIIHSGREDEDVSKAFSLIREAVDAHFKAVQLFKEMPKQ